MNVRLRFALAASLPALATLAVMALVADRLARGALEDELGSRLVAVAQAAATALPADRVIRLEPGDEGTRTYGHVRARIDGLARATGTRIFVLRPDRAALADSAGRARIGEPIPALEVDRLEIALAAAGRAVPSQVLFVAEDGLPHKTGYAPLLDPSSGKPVAVVAAEGTAASFATLRGFRRLLFTFAIAGAAVGALVAALAAVNVTRPLLRLTVAAKRIARGDLESPIWKRLRRDEIKTLRDTMEEMRLALRARDEEREALLAGIAHEVRNPLGGMDLFTGLLAEGKGVAVVGADGTAPSFETLREFRRTLATVGVAGALLGALVAALAAVTVTRPLLRITEAARRIARGDLETPLWRRRRRDEIGTLRDTIEEMRRALHARDEERETLLAGIAHEVRNPLGAIDLFAGLLEEELRDATSATHVARIRSELAALSKVVEEFLDYARARPPLREEVDLPRLLGEVADLVQPLASSRAVSLSLEGAGEARADREQLRRAAVNLVRNAVEATPPGGVVEIAARVRDGEAAVEVADRGSGLTPEARESLFRPFFTTKDRGTGLGLALAKKVADAHGGALSLEDREGGGTVARLVLPAAPPE